MSCYFRHIKDIFDELKIEVTNDNKKEIDKIFHKIVDIEYKNCSPTWKEIKIRLKGDNNLRDKFIKNLKKEIKYL